VSGLYDHSSHLVPGQTDSAQHATLMTRRDWRQIVVLYTLLTCAPLFFAYSNFRAYKGDAFSAAVQSVQGTYGVGRSTRFSMEWREFIVHTVDGYAEVHLQLEYGRLPVEPVILPSDYPRYRTTVKQGSTTLHVDVYTNLSQLDFYRLHPAFVSGLVEQFRSPQRVSLPRALWTRMTLLPWQVLDHTWFPGFLPSYDTMTLGRRCFITAINEFPGIPVLAVLVLVPWWLALPVFWLWVVLSVLYVVLPQRAWGWMKALVVRFRHRA